MSRIEWSRISGEDVEHVVAVLLCSQNPSALMIRPASGDGGLDVVVPVGEDEHDVYQVKKFATNLTNGQKRQITKSYNRLCKTIADGDIKVRNWYLAVPLDPTPGNKSWFDGLTKDSDFHCEWRGLSFIESLAAAFPNVIDYYLRSGSERLRSTAIDLSALARDTQPNEAGVITPTEIWPVLQAALRVTDTDPHFRYGVNLSPVEPAPPQNDGAVTRMVMYDGDLDFWITVSVYARFAEALKERPITVKVNFRVEPGTTLHSDLGNWQKYGKPFIAPPGSVDIKADLPGGLGGDIFGGALSLGSFDTQPSRNRLVLGVESGTPLATVYGEITKRSTSADGQGLWASGHESGRVFVFEHSGHLGERTLQISWKLLPLAGKRPSDLIPGLRFLSVLPEATAFAFAEEFGRVSKDSYEPIDGGAFARNLPAKQLGVNADLAEALVTIQEHTSHQMLFPNLDGWEPKHVHDLIAVARLLRGETIRSQGSVVVAGTFNEDFPNDPFEMAGTQPLAINWEDNVLQLGELHMFGAAVTAHQQEPDDDGSARYELRPVGNAVWVYSTDDAILPTDVANRFVITPP